VHKKKNKLDPEYDTVSPSMALQEHTEELSRSGCGLRGHAVKATSGKSLLPRFMEAGEKIR
jgi:hypothetical protein